MDKKRYNLELLQSFVKDNNVELIGNYENVNRNTKVSGKCLTLECEETFCKSFIKIIKKGGPYCKECTKLNIVKKCKKTCLEKYGVESPLQNEGVKNKIKETCLEKYNCENPFQNEEVKQKYKQTCLEKYGVECPMQNSSIREKLKETCLKKYGVEHPKHCEEVKQKYKQTCLEKYGVECSFQSKEIKEKIKITCLEKYGVDYPFQSKEVKEKIKKTFLNKYNCENPFQNEEIKEKIKDTNLKIYGYQHPMQSEIFKEKIKQTCLKNHGVENPSQNSEICEKQLKSSFNKKEYILPSGEILQVQGYEYLALDILIYHENIDENYIVVSRKDVPEIWYDDNGKYHRYYVDIFIKSLNKCIEVKCDYLFNRDKNIVLLKHKYVKYNGYNSEIWIFNNKKTLIKVIE